MCGKWASEDHLNAGSHILKMEEHAMGQIMAGRSLSTRRQSGIGYQGKATKKTVLEFWGDELQSMAHFAEQRHKHMESAEPHKLIGASRRREAAE